MECDAAMNIIVGENAQGKTTILEAIHVLGLAKSHRTNLDTPLIREGESFAKAQARCDLAGRRERLEVIISEQGKRIRRNDVEQPRLSDHIGHLHVVMFAPEDLELVKGSPADRRRFLDQGISQFDRRHIRHLARYRKLLKERNEYLKTLAKNKKAPDSLLEVLGEQLAHYAKKIIVARRDFIAELGRYAGTIYAEMSAEDPVEIRYEPSADAEGFEEALRKKRRIDILTGSTSIGPHRDDCGLYSGNETFKTKGSQGQFRSLAIALKIAVVEIIREQRGVTPVILLDDVFSELDENRQKKLVRLLDKDGQVFITTTREGAVHPESLKKGKVFKIHAGKIEGVSNYGPRQE